MEEIYMPAEQIVFCQIGDTYDQEQNLGVSDEPDNFRVYKSNQHVSLPISSATFGQQWTIEFFFKYDIFDSDGTKIDDLLWIMQ